MSRLRRAFASKDVFACKVRRDDAHGCGTQGVGAAVARAATAEGATVAITGRRPEPGEALAASIRAGGSLAMFVHADVAHVAQAQASQR
jgi:NAD(P)-dependent dehydrogenase (short-subunit alcohol dehydrogenase family)